MVRKYVHKKRRPWRDKDRRMARAAELRAAGWSMRRIADRLVVSVGTVHADLTRWDAEHPDNVTPLRSERPFKSAPTGAKLNAASERPANVTPIRRSS
jgi:hypothetical protein